MYALKLNICLFISGDLVSNTGQTNIIFLVMFSYLGFFLVNFIQIKNL